MAVHSFKPVFLQDDVGKTILVAYHSNYLIEKLISNSTISVRPVLLDENITVTSGYWKLFSFKAGTIHLMEDACKQIIQVS